MLAHLSIPILQDKWDINTSNVHLPPMHVNSEEPAVEDIACPVAKLGLNQPMTDFFRPVMGGGSILSVEKEVHPDLGVQCPFPAY